MKIEINETDFDTDGRPVGAFKRCVKAWAMAICSDVRQSRPALLPAPDSCESSDSPAAVLPLEGEVTPQPGRYAEERREATQGQVPPTETAPPEPTESKPKTKKRRTRAEIDAADDAACQIEIVAAVREGREPDKKNLPADTRRRVGQNPKSWIDPAVYAQITAGPAGPVDPDPEPVDPEPVADFSSFIDNEPTTAHDETTQRFEIGNKLVQLGQLSRPAAVKVVEGWKQEYNTTAVPDIPAEHLGAELARVEAALDAETPE